MNKAVILASGGMDSYLAWYLYARDALNVFVNLGQPYAHKEKAALRNLGMALRDFKWRAITGPEWGQYELPSGIIPMRNALLILMAAQYGNDIVMGVLEGEVNSDKSAEFMQAIGATMSISGRGQYWNDYQGTAYKVRSPIKDMSKTELVEEYLHCAGSVHNLLLTVSCYSGKGGKQCGACPSCFKRWVALTNCDIADEYDAPPRAYGILKEYDRGSVAMRKANPHWSDKRIEEIVLAMSHPSA